MRARRWASAPAKGRARACGRCRGAPRSRRRTRARPSFQVIAVEERRVRAGDVRVIKVDAVAVDVGDRGELEAEDVVAAGETGVVREAEQVAGAVGGDRRHRAAGQLADDDRRALLDVLAIDARRDLRQLLAVAQVAERPGRGLAGAGDAGARGTFDRRDVERPAEPERARADARVVVERELRRVAGATGRDLDRVGQRREAARRADLVGPAEALDRGGALRDVDRGGQRGAGVGERACRCERCADCERPGGASR
jgi:hypothetical protein